MYLQISHCWWWWWLLLFILEYSQSHSCEILPGALVPKARLTKPRLRCRRTTSCLLLLLLQVDKMVDNCRFFCTSLLILIRHLRNSLGRLSSNCVYGKLGISYAGKSKFARQKSTQTEHKSAPLLLQPYETCPQRQADELVCFAEAWILASLQQTFVTTAGCCWRKSSGRR